MTSTLHKNYITRLGLGIYKLKVSFNRKLLPNYLTNVVLSLQEAKHHITD
jgi:hypothetical protein